MKYFLNGCVFQQVEDEAKENLECTTLIENEVTTVTVSNGKDQGLTKYTATSTT